TLFRSRQSRGGANGEKPGKKVGKTLTKDGRLCYTVCPISQRRERRICPEPRHSIAPSCLHGVLWLCGNHSQRQRRSTRLPECVRAVPQADGEAQPVKPNTSRPGMLPAAEGLYDPQFEHDACGVGFVAHIKGEKSHAIVEKAIGVLVNLAHRGACGCDPETGDGAGILLQLPHAFFQAELAAQKVTLPPAGEYGVGMLFLPRDAQERQQCEA